MKYFVATRLTERISLTPEGYLLCLAVPIARTGEMLYGAEEVEELTPNENGELIITRDEKEVFSPLTIASFEGKSVTIKHPEEFVSPENWKELTVGIIQNVRRGTGEFLDSLLADLLITDKDAINLVQGGLREVSCGYAADYEQEDDEEGTGKQSNIRGNHLALVDSGRAGSSYAINDHKRKGTSKMKIADMLKKARAKFADAQKEMDEAMEAAGKDASLGGEQSKQDPHSGKPATADADMYDELKQMVKDLGSKMDMMSKPKDEAVVPPAKKENAEGGEQANDDDPMEARMKALEDKVSQLLEKMSGGTGDEEEMADADKDEEESEDDDHEESSLVGDAAAPGVASKAEILSPGIAMSKDIKKKALTACYATAEGKKIIDMLNGGKPTFDSKEKTDMLFNAASQLLRAERTKDFAKTKQTRDVDGTSVNAGYKSAEELNAINEKFYKGAH